MIAALGIASSAPSTGASQSTVALQAQLARYQTELAQWLNCPSCKTPEGKAKIAEISTRIGDVQQRIGAADSASKRSPASGIARSAGVEAAFSITGPAAAPGLVKDGPLGQRLDVFA